MVHNVVCQRAMKATPPPRYVYIWIYKPPKPYKFICIIFDDHQRSRRWKFDENFECIWPKYAYFLSSFDLNRQLLWARFLVFFWFYKFLLISHTSFRNLCVFPFVSFLSQNQLFFISSSECYRFTTNNIIHSFEMFAWTKIIISKFILGIFNLMSWIILIYIEQRYY